MSSKNLFVWKFSFRKDKETFTSLKISKYVCLYKYMYLFIIISLTNYDIVWIVTFCKYLVHFMAHSLHCSDNELLLFSFINPTEYIQ